MSGARLRAVPSAPMGAPRGGESAVDQLLACPGWSDAAVAEAGLELRDAVLVSVGGGLGSFCLVDLLRNAGAPSHSVSVVSPFQDPGEQFRHLCRRGQISAEDGLRSDSGSRVDNIWGWPGYAVEEALRRRSPAPLWRVFAEPVLAEPYTPPSWLVEQGLRREAQRIGWRHMLHPGHAQVVRPRERGGYFVLTCPAARAEAVGSGAGASTADHRPVVLRTRYVHLALGHSGLRLSEETRRYREAFGDRIRVVSAYEPHEHVYSSARLRPTTVLVRGAGITAARILERLVQERQRFGGRTQIVHLVRRAVGAPTGTRGWRRPAGDGFSYQHFSFPKAASGGQIRELTEQLPPDERHALIQSIGGATTPRRHTWEVALRQARAGGWYHSATGQVVGFFSTDGGEVEVVWQSDGRPTSAAVDFVIDATGMMEDADHHPLVADLLGWGGIAVTRLGGLGVTRGFEVRATRNGPGRIYASGALVRGAHLAPVDSFAGLNAAAAEIAAELAEEGFIARLSPGRSCRAWWRWVRGREVPVA